MKKIAFTILLCFICFNLSFAHSGRTDRNGGHFNRKTGQYHYHNNKSDNRFLYIAGIALVLFIGYKSVKKKK